MENTEGTLMTRTSGTRYVELDGLRGLAALSVLGHHFSFIYGIHLALFAIPLAAGHEAVMLFFVLSGFVLSLPYWCGREADPYGIYLVRRCFRIYVPYVAALLLAVIGDLALGRHHLPLNEWYYWTWQAKVTPKLVFGQLLMDPTPQLNTAFWSLRYEVQFSIVLPFLLLILSRVRLITGLIACIVASAAAAVLQRKGFADGHYYLETLRYLPVFASGALLARYRSFFQMLWLRTARPMRLVFVMGVALLYWGYEHPLLVRLHLEFLHACFTLCGAGGLILAAINSGRLQKVLRSRLCEYFGRISYSLYLVHGTVLFSLVNLFYWKLSKVWMCVLFVVLSMVMAHLFCVFIEEPSRRVGTRFASYLRGWVERVKRSEKAVDAPQLTVTTFTSGENA